MAANNKTKKPAGTRSNAAKPKQNGAQQTSGTRKTKEEKLAEIQAEKQKTESSRRLHDIIIGIVHIALGIFIFVSVQFDMGGAFGNNFGLFLKGVFGLIGLILPWYLIVIGLLLIVNRARHFKKSTILVSVFLLILLCLLNSGRFIEDGNLFADLGTYYTNGTELKDGGFIGMLIGTLIVKAFGKSGLYIFTSAGIIICLLLLLRTPLSAMYDK